jgi:O-antigen ligase
MTKTLETTTANKLIFLLLCVVLIFTTLAYGAVHQPIIAIVYIFATVILILWAFDAFMSGELRFNRSLLQIPLLAVFVYGLIQIIPFGSVAEIAGVSGIPRTISLDPYRTQINSFHYLALLIFFAAFLTFFDSAKRLRTFVYVVTIFGFMFAFFAILQYVLSPTKIYGIYERPYVQPFGSFVNRHNFAAYMEMTICLPLGLLFVGAVPRDKRLLYITAVGLMGVALLLSGSRGGLVAILSAVFFLIILTTKSKNYGQFALKISLAVLLFATIIGGTIFVGGESSLTRIAETATSKDITTNRVHIWSVTLEIIKNNLPFGAGIGAYGVSYTKFDNSNGLERVEQAHNDYLQVLSDMGVVGLLIGAFFVFWLFRTGLQSVKTKNAFRRGIAIGALAGCFAILVHSVFDFVLHTTAISILFLALVALVVQSGDEYADDSEEKIEPRRRSESGSAIVKPFKRNKKRSRGRLSS